MSILAKRLKQLREDAELKQYELAEKLGVSNSNITKYENGSIPNVPYDILIKYADYFNTTIDYLVGRTDIKDSVIVKATDIEVEHDKSISYTDEELDKIKFALDIILNKKK